MRWLTATSTHKPSPETCANSPPMLSDFSGDGYAIGKFSLPNFVGNIQSLLIIVDFVCLEKKLIIEVDGGQHAEQIDYDLKRTRFLESQGFRVLRFWNNEVLAETDVVLGVIYGALGESDFTDRR
ncbi:MAG: endonuclease domain-containing protein [Ectothiorhodospiraceae bacterium]|nr:endonuclease domain-containing protein [Ectothiorhodospiraceae bacterium]